MRFFALATKTLIGLDIGARYLKLIVLSQNPTSPQSVEVQYYAVVELPMMVLTENNDIKEHATISATLIQLKNDAKLNCHNVAIALPGSAVVTQQIFVARDQTEAQCEDQVWLEAAKHFPDLIEDLSLDFYNNGPAENDDSHWDILLVACRKASMEKRLNILQDSHLQAQVVDVDYYALERSLRYILQQQPLFALNHTYALLHFSAHTSTLVVLQNQRLSYAHDQSFDSQALLLQLQQQLHWPNIITQSELLPETLDEAATQLLSTQLLGHVQHVLQLFHTSNQGDPIEHLFLAGDCALIPSLAALVQLKTGLNASIANPLIQMRIGAGVNQHQLSISAPLLCLCSGLALNVLNHDQH